MKFFLTKVAKVFGDFWAVNKSPFLRLLFGQLLEKNWATFILTSDRTGPDPEFNQSMPTRSTKFRLIFGHTVLDSRNLVYHIRKYV